MKTEKKNRLSFFSALYENAKNAYAPALMAMERNMAQYGGDDRIDGSHETASIVRNITYELIEGEISSVIPAPRVSAAVYSEKNDRNAKSVEELCAMLRDLLPFEEMNDRDERYTYVYGGSVWFLEWDDTPLYGKRAGGVRVSCLPPHAFIPEPYVCEVDDMEYCFLRYMTTKDDLVRRFGVKPCDADRATAEAESASASDESLVTVVVCFYKNEDGDVARFVFSGDVTLADEGDYYGRRRAVCRTCHASRADCKCEQPSFAYEAMTVERLSHDLLLSDGRVIPKASPAVDGSGFIRRRGGDAVMETTEIPYYRPRRFPIVLRRNVSKEGELFGESDAYAIRHQQQALNKVESRIMQKLMRAGVTPVVPDDAELTLTNAIFGQVLKTKPGESANAYGILDTTPSIQQDIMEAERLYLQAKRILGISDTFIGLDDVTAISGRAKEIQIAQASGRLESKRRMKNAAYARIDRIIFELYLAYGDDVYPIPYKDMLGRTHNALFNRYDFVEYTPDDGSYRYGDDYLFSVDTAGNMESQRETLWQKNLENLQAGTLGEPTATETLLRYWQTQERAHYPYARDNVEYFRERLSREASVLPSAAAGARASVNTAETGAMA